jgi:hypothetical protein
MRAGGGRKLKRRGAGQGGNVLIPNDFSYTDNSQSDCSHFYAPSALIALGAAYSR